MSRARRGLARRGAAPVARPRLLRPRPQPARLRASRRGPARRRIPGRISAALRALPGIGDYTAAAIAAIAFDQPYAAVDGNVERVMARVFAERAPLPAAKPRLRALAASLVPQQRAGDFAQAMMDLGAMLCTPRRPRCVLCPWRPDCAAAAAGIAEELPARGGKAGTAAALRGGVLAQPAGRTGTAAPAPGTGPARRHDRTALDTMAGRALDRRRRPPPTAPADAAWTALPGTVRHGFTHFRLELALLRRHHNRPRRRHLGRARRIQGLRLSDPDPKTGEIRAVGAIRRRPGTPMIRHDRACCRPPSLS